MKNKKYIIYGANGFMGSNIASYLRKKKLKVITPNKKQILNTKGVVIYCVGSDDWFGNPLKNYESNFVHLYNVIKSHTKFESFVFLSSTRVYLDSKKKLISEDDDLILNTTSRYKFNSQKIICENFLLSQNKNIKIIRLSNVYGKQNEQKTFLPSLIKDAVKKNKINIQLNINSSKDYIYLDDALRGIYLLAKNKKAHGIFNLAYGKNFKVKDIIKIIKKETKCNIKFSNKRNLEQFPKINLNKIKKIINFKVKKNLIQMIPELINIEKKY